jgi:hypothetical protein
MTDRKRSLQKIECSKCHQIKLVKLSDGEIKRYIERFPSCMACGIGTRPLRKKNCENCGKEFMSRRTDRHFCSRGCYVAIWALRHVGKVPSEETRRKIGKKNRINTKEYLKTHNVWNKGIKWPEMTGENSPNWRGGKSFCVYPRDWNKTLKQSIRQRDNYTCQICGEEPSVQVHHIDYIKKNCNPTNLVTLCRSCHTKTCFNREYWIKFFKKQEGGQP